jgi:hypothetical protein
MVTTRLFEFMERIVPILRRRFNPGGYRGEGLSKIKLLSRADFVIRWMDRRLSLCFDETSQNGGRQ